MSLFTPVGARQAEVVRFHNRGWRGAVTAAAVLVDLAEGEFEGHSSPSAHGRYLFTRSRVFSSEEFGALEAGGSPRYRIELGGNRPSRRPGPLWSADPSS